MENEFGENLRDFVEGECPPGLSFKSLLEDRIPESAKRGAYGGKWLLCSTFIVNKFQQENCQKY